MVTTIQSELVPAQPELPAVPLSPNASVTDKPAFPDAKSVIKAVRAAAMEKELLARGYREMAVELSEWSETGLVAQAETLPEE